MEKKEQAIFKVTIAAPIENVWDRLTNTHDVLPFFFNSRIDTHGLKQGAQIRMRTKNGKYTGVIGEVLEWDPPHRYSHSFKFTQLDDEPCIVTYDLKATQEGTEFTLTASEIPSRTKTEQYMKQGGDFIVATLKAVVENKSLPLYSKFILWMCAITQPFTPKKALSEHWPLSSP